MRTQKRESLLTKAGEQDVRIEIMRIVLTETEKKRVDQLSKKAGLIGLVALGSAMKIGKSIWDTGFEAIEQSEIILKKKNLPSWKSMRDHAMSIEINK